MLGTRYKKLTRIIDQKGFERKWAILMATDASLLLSRQLGNLRLGWTRIVMYRNWIGYPRRIRASYMFNPTYTHFIHVARFEEVCMENPESQGQLGSHVEIKVLSHVVLRRLRESALFVLTSQGTVGLNL